MADHMVFKNRERARFIMGRLINGGLVRQDLMQHFGVSQPTASAMIGRFIEEHPDWMVYDKSAKRYVSGPGFTGARPVDGDLVGATVR